MNSEEILQASWTFVRMAWRNVLARIGELPQNGILICQLHASPRGAADTHPYPHHPYRLPWRTLKR
jgi:hypothetical protein